MKKIRVYTGRYALICLEENCIYKDNCGNHCSAGTCISRPGPDGFAPELESISSLDSIINTFYCKTIDQNPVYGDQTLPINHEDLKKGCIILGENGNLKHTKN